MHCSKHPLEKPQLDSWFGIVNPLNGRCSLRYGRFYFQASLVKEYGISQTALTNWIKQYSTVEVANGEILTSKQIKELQKRMAQLEEENQILKKQLPYSRHTQATIRRRI